MQSKCGISVFVFEQIDRIVIALSPILGVVLSFQTLVLCFFKRYVSPYLLHLCKALQLLRLLYQAVLRPCPLLSLNLPLLNGFYELQKFLHTVAMI